jgi:hypothetical protein
MGSCVTMRTSHSHSSGLPSWCIAVHQLGVVQPLVPGLASDRLLQGHPGSQQVHDLDRQMVVLYTVALHVILHVCQLLHHRAKNEEARRRAQVEIKRLKVRTVSRTLPAALNIAHGTMCIVTT